ncbi:hypothetical protein A2W48_02965 [Candidatus Giovannonibacteria bacterium RIFCSPHIGHO2_12_44_12]|uniref:Peptidase M15C domain-containing protein n=1 Tax=Candidatus Giovannonibacteria bacterium RIFCSPHIGHO2_12_44_12 TaxID=1798340 RepID=A0A1F5WXQ2_9BACT|nr:MAG: hypothetical protein A2W48_02965 [Candidatus Giovannonibacteria bacterium RIFCSPHIGHO2_12_44_12]
MSWYEEKIKKHPQYTNSKLVADLNILYPPLALNILKIFTLARKEGLSVCVYETYRSQERQTELFNKGVTKLKTNGMHHFGVATDIVFLDRGNNPSWDEKYDWKRLGEIGKSFGLIWGGDWPWDKPHFQLIPATVPDQGKIIKGEYPVYESSVNQCVTDLLSLYERVLVNKFSDSSIAEMVSYVENIGKKPVIEVVEISPILVTESESQPIVPVVNKLETVATNHEIKNPIIDFINSILKVLFRR